MDRERLTEEMLDHVLGVLGAHRDVGSVLLLADSPRAGCGLIEDRGRGLNAELEAARASLATDMLVVHADLPLIDADDITALLNAAAAHGAAIAGDRHGGGTNALALCRSAAFAFHFGPDSRRLHGEQLNTTAALMDRPGLAIDVDTPEDMRLADALLRER